MLKAKLFYKQGCFKCKLTERQLKLPIESFDITNDHHKIESLQAQGIQSLPVVRIVDVGSDGYEKRLDMWNDFNFDKIREWNKKIDEMSVD